MGLFDIIRRKKMPEATARVLYEDTTVRDQERNARHYRPRDIPAIEAMERAVGVVYQCADTNASVCSSQPLRMYRRVKMTNNPVRKSLRAYMESGHAGKAVAEFASGQDDLEMVEQHPAITLLRDPSPDMNGLQWSWLRFFMKEMTGKAYSLVGWSERSGRPISLNPLLSQYTEILLDTSEGGDGGLVGFLYGRNEREAVELAPEDVLYFRHSVSPHNPYSGVGPLQAVLAEADLLVSVLMHDKTMADRGYMPAAIATIPSDATEEQARMVGREFNARGGPQSGARIHVARAGELKLEPLSWNPKDLQTGEQIERYERRIRQAFGHTESMADSNASTYASALVGYSEQYMGATIRPRLARDASELTQYMADLFGFDPDEYCLVYDDPVVSDVESLTTRLITQRQAGILSINEVRTELGYERVEGNKDADDPTYVASPAAPDPLALFGGSVGGGPQRVVDTREDKTEPVGSKSAESDNEPFDVRAIADGTMPDRYTPCGCCTKAVDSGDIAKADPLLAEVFDRFGDDAQDAMESALEDLQDEYVRAFTEGGTPDVDDLVEQIRAEMREQLIPAVAVVTDSVRRSLELTDDVFEIVDRDALAFLESHVSRVASDIDATTREAIRAATQRGIEQGLTVADVQSEIQSAGLPKYRAEMIARTELSEVSHGAKYTAWKAAGVTHLRWKNAPGATIAHQEIASRSPKKMGEPFALSGEVIKGEKITRDVYYPPARPNCRCTIVIEEVDE
jgi:HK97 family phage portal protein